VRHQRLSLSAVRAHPRECGPVCEAKWMWVTNTPPPLCTHCLFRSPHHRCSWYLSAVLYSLPVSCDRVLAAALGIARQRGFTVTTDILRAFVVNAAQNTSLECKVFTLVSHWFHTRSTLVSPLFHTRFTLVSPSFHPRFTLVSRSFHTRFTLVSHSFHTRFARVSHSFNTRFTLVSPSFHTRFSTAVWEPRIAVYSCLHSCVELVFALMFALVCAQVLRSFYPSSCLLQGTA
jgi:hypothetical protein